MKAVFHPRNEVIGLSRRFGLFYISTDNSTQEVSIEITIPADENCFSSMSDYFASLHVHYDGVALLNELGARGFLDEFGRLKACTFYDILQCLHVADINLTCYDDDKQMVSRQIYDLLYAERR